MPTASYVLPDQAGMGFRMVLDSVCRQLARRMEIPEDTIFFYQADGEEVQKQPQSALNSAWQKAGFTVPDKMTVTYDKYIVGEKRLTNTMIRTNTPTVFLDDETGLFVKPVYRYTGVDINISLRFKSRSQGINWLRSAERRMNARIADEYHELEYHYPLPDPALRLICEAYDRKYHWLPEPPETFEQYVHRCLTPRATRIVNQAANHPTTVIREAMTRVIGSPKWLDGDLNSNEPQGSNGTYGVSLQYHFEYDAVDGIVVGFPQVVHNKLMPIDVLLPFIKKRPNPWERVEMRSQSAHALHVAGKVEERWSMPNASEAIARQPYWDEFKPGYVNPQHHPILSSLILLDPAATDKRMTINLENMDEVDGGTWRFTDAAIAYMKANHQYLHLINQDVLHVNVYAGEEPNWKNGVTVDQDLNVVFDEDPDYSKTYRILVNMQFDIGILSIEALERLRLNYQFAYEVITLLYLGDESLTLRELTDGSMNRTDFNYAVGLIREQIYKRPRPKGGIWPLVMPFAISAERKEDSK